jgi:acyl-coenzyme A thioesterase PaaI-like protein
VTAPLDQRDSHILSELGFDVRYVGSDLEGTASVVPELCAPDSSHLRTSVLAIWADHLTGLLAAIAMEPRVPVTLELDVNLFQPAPGYGTVRGRARMLKSGRSVFVASVDFVSGRGEPVAFGAASFTAAPDPGLSLPLKLDFDGPSPTRRLSMPLAERAGCRLREPGVAVLPRSDDGLNSSNTVNGGLIALAVEEAALSLTPGSTLCSLALRYMRPLRVGPVVATAQMRSRLGRVEVRDAGSENRLSCLATTRSFSG